MRPWFPLALFATCLTTLAIAPPVEAARPRTRAEFVAALRQVVRRLHGKEVRRSAPEGPIYDRERFGMPAERVRRLLGSPDAVVASSEGVPLHIVGFAPEPGEEVWRYGARTPSGFATLGEVLVDSRRQAVAVRGAYGTPIRSTVLPESELRALLEELAELPDPFGSPREEGPGPWLRVANRLHALGRERALAVIEEYLRVRTFSFHPREYSADGPHALHTLMQLLFPGTPEALGGMNTIAEVGGVPVVMRYAGGIGGSVSFSFEELELYRKHGRWRREPFVPAADLLAAVDAAAARGESPLSTPVLRGQALLLLRSVYRPDDGRDLRRTQALSGPEAEARWAQARAEVARLGLRWDPGKCTYTFADGTTLPEEWAPQKWAPALPAPAPRIRLRRTSVRSVEIAPEWEGAETGSVALLTARQLTRGGLERRVLRSWILESGKREPRWLWLEEGVRFELEISAGPVTRTSPVFEL